MHGCDLDTVKDGSRLALYQTLYIECPSIFFSFFFIVSFLFRYVFLLSLELCICSSDIFLSSRPRTGLATTYISGYVVVVVVVSHIQCIGCQPEKLLSYTVANPARGLLNREKIKLK